MGTGGTTLHVNALAPGWEPVRIAVEAVLGDRPGHAVAVAAYFHGRCVVDVWGGDAYGPDSVQVVWSSTKGVVAACLGLLVEQGRLDPSAPVTDYWPEFGQSGKAAATVSDVLSHRAGVPAIDIPLSIADWASERAETLVAQQRPYWPPGTAHGYHAVTWGVLAQALLRRVDGRSVGQFLAEEIATPRGIEFWIGLPPELEQRVVPLVPPTTAVRDPTDETPAQADIWASAPFLSDERNLNSRLAHSLQLPALNGVGSARGLARLYAALISEVDGLPSLYSDTTLAEVVRERSAGMDRASGAVSRFALGFQLPTPGNRMSGEGSFGHEGRGGTVAFGDPVRGITLAFTSSVMPPVAGADPAAAEIVAAALSSSARQNSPGANHRR